MPFETRLFIKTGMAYLLATFVVGAALLVLEAIGRPAPGIIGVEHGHMGFVGWLVNVVIGVALWMFPLAQADFPDTRGRYPVAAALWCYWLLNAGLVVRIVVEPSTQLVGVSPSTSALLILAATSQLAAIGVFVGIVWRRVRAPSRPASGVR